MYLRDFWPSWHCRFGLQHFVSSRPTLTHPTRHTPTHTVLSTRLATTMRMNIATVIWCIHIRISTEFLIGTMTSKSPAIEAFIANRTARRSVVELALSESEPYTVAQLSAKCGKIPNPVSRATVHRTVRLLFNADGSERSFCITHRGFINLPTTPIPSFGYAKTVRGFDAFRQPRLLHSFARWNSKMISLPGRCGLRSILDVKCSAVREPAIRAPLTTRHLSRKIIRIRNALLEKPGKSPFGPLCYHLLTEVIFFNIDEGSVFNFSSEPSACWFL